VGKLQGGRGGESSSMHHGKGIRGVRVAGSGREGGPLRPVGAR